MYRIPLGPFELHEPVGKGGMGEVWRGVHVAQQVPVAVKVLTRDGARRASYLESFHNEVRAAAGLHHPGVVVVLDSGLISQPAERASLHRLVAGSPYLVMELARHGSLFDYIAGLQWHELRPVLLTILAALAHAHARGVIHRDLKPQNILIGCGELDSVKLTDFGLAHAVDRHRAEAPEDAGWGTPHYMAPEQFRGAWRDYGPWTDLYALGVMTFELVSGAMPFEGESSWELGRAHITQPAPRLMPRFRVPDGLERWVLRLLQKEPQARFQRAADAMHALLALGDLPDAAPVATLTGRFGRVEVERAPAPPTVIVAQQQPETELLSPQQLAFVDEARRLRPAPSARADQDDEPLDAGFAPGALPLSAPHLKTEETDLSPLPSPPLPLPESWREGAHSAPSLRLLGAGQGLFGLRTVPLVGRDAQRDALWASLAQVVSQRRPHVVVLRGGAGVGKSRLAQWLSERAHEVGAAHLLRATYSPSRGPFDGLAAALCRDLRGVGLTRQLIQERARQVIAATGTHDRELARALAELLIPDEEVDPQAMLYAPRPAPPSHAQRFGIMRRYIEQIGESRPVVLWADDAQWGAEALMFARHVLAQPEPHHAPLLMVLTVRDDALVPGSLEALLLDELLAHARVSQHAMRPLQPADFAALVRELLGLEDALARQVEQRAQGVPLFAVQLVGDWIARDVLEVGQGGFTLRPGKHAALPDDIHAIWSSRLERVAPDAIPALRAAAALGVELADVEWREVCERVGASLSSDALARLRASGLLLAREEDRGWAFAHGMLRESLERDAREAGQWPALNAACAAMLRSRHPRGGARSDERLARHLLQADQLEDALAPLLRAAAHRMALSDLATAISLLDEREATLNRLTMPDHDARRGEGWVMRSRVLDQQGRYLEALRWAAAAMDLAARYSAPELFLSATISRGYAALHRGLTGEAKALFGRAIEGLSAPSSHRVSCLIGMARATQRQGKLAEAHDLFQDALAQCERLGDELSAATCLNGLGDVARQARDFDAAHAHASRALAITERLNNRILSADCLNDLAELRRLQGRWDEATALCERAIATYVSVGSDQAMRARLNLALIYLGASDFERATPLLRTLFEHFRVAQDYSQLALASVGVLPCLARSQQWDKLAEAIVQAERLLTQTDRRDADVPFAALMARDLLPASQRATLGARLEGLASRFGPLPYV